MTTSVFKTSLKPVLGLCQFIGLVDICYAFDPTGLSIRYTNSMYFKFLELTRMSALLTCTYAAYQSELYYSQKLDLLKFWAPVIVGRISEVWMIRLINGIVEFDRRFASRLPAASSPVRRPARDRWRSAIASGLAYWIGVRVFYVCLWPPRNANVTAAACYLFMSPSVMEVTVAVAAWFFLGSLERRFQTLNDIVAERLPTAVPGRWTDAGIAAQLEAVRLSHAELTELLDAFSLGFGPLLLGFFVLTFVSILYYCLFSIKIALSLPELGYAGNFLRNLPLYVMNVQNMIFMTSVIVLSSRITHKKKEIVSYFRLCRISNSPTIIKSQVKMFMDQISFTESITAYGFFNIDSNQIVSILVLLITGLATLLQMRDHQILLRLVNNSTSTAESSFHNIKAT